MKAIYTPLKYTPTAGHLRLYTEGNTYEEKDPYDCIMTVEILPRGGIWISGAHGRLNPKAVRDWVIDMGIKYVHYERDGEFINDRSFVV